MAVDTPSGPTAPRPTFQEGMDSLWKFQLRKENAALLEKQDATTKQLQQVAADAIKNKKNFDERMTALETQTIKNKKEFDERMAALETTILNLQSEERRDRHAFEKYGEEMATLRSQMGVVMDTFETRNCQPAEGISVLPHQLVTCSLSTGQRTGPHSGISSSQDGVADISELPKTTSGVNSNTNIDSRMPAPTSIKTLKYVSAPVPAPITNAGFHTTNRAANLSSETVGPMTRSRSRSRSAEAPTSDQRQMQIPVPAIRPQAAVPTSIRTATAETPPKLPRLHQGHSSYKSYLDKANSAYESLPHSGDQKFEIEFIASFIKGITNEDKRNILVAELQQQHQSRRKNGGKIEILCEWKDVAEGMKAAGLLQVATGGARTGPKDRHRGSQFKNELKGLLQD